MEVKVCPACQSGDARPTGPEAPGFTVRADTKNFVQEPYAVTECAQCGLLYKTRCLTAEEFADYYARINFRRWEIPGFYPTERAVLAILRRMPFGSKILDFGCSSGRLLAPLVSTCRCYGYDLNRTATADAHAKGIEIMAEREFACAPDGSFDVVILVDVFEHFLSPTSLLSRLISLIKPGGLLIIVTGNGDNAFCRLDPAQFWYFRNIEHIIMLTRRYAE